MIEGLNSQLDTLGEEIKKAGESQKRIDKTINKHFEKQDKQIKDLLENVRGIQNDYHKKDRTQFLGKHFFLTLPLAILVCFIVFTNNYNFYYLENKLLVFVVALGLLASLGGILWYIYNTTTRPSLLSPRFKAIGLTLSAVTLIAFVVAWIRMPIKTVDELIVKYDFGKQHAKGDNGRAVQIVEDYLKENEENEEARLFLAKYYLNIANDKEKALEVTSPMRLDTKKYPKGSVYAVEALYESDPDNETIIMHVGEFIDMYRKEYGNQMDNVPAEINRLEGIINCYNNKELEKGVALLKYAADIQDDSKAQYHMGWITSHIMEQSGKGGVQDTLFNLITAIKYLKKALNKEPKAALELGTLYADLNMKDSAEYYFQKVISNSDKKLNIEAKYKMGLLLESKGDSTNKYFAEARAAEYTPALLHTAINKQNHKEAIRYYEVAGRYKGHRYIPPIVFEYIHQGNNGAALDTLCSTRAHGNFNEEFVEGVRATIVEKDSIRAMECWRQSAEKGCKYAKMICLFRDIEHDINNNRFREESLNELKRISDEITFANVLIAKLLQQQGLFLLNRDGLNLEQFKSYFYFKEAEMFGKMAIFKGHPGGILVLNDGLGFISHWERITKNETSKNEKAQELIFYYLLLRMSSEKQNVICFGYRYDYDLQNHYDDANWGDTHVSFWKDIAISNGDFNSIIMILSDNIYNSNFKDIKTMVSYAIDSITPETDVKIQEVLSSCIGRLKHDRSEDFRDYFLLLGKKYENDPFKINLIINNEIIRDHNIPARVVFPIRNVDNNSIIYEFGNIADHFYDKAI